MSKIDSNKTKFPKSDNLKFLASVPFDRGFHFSTAGEYTGETATSLPLFVKMLQVVNMDSINFHFKRQDFQKWIKDVIGDKELSQRIGKIDKQISGEELRKEILEIVQVRVTELQKLYN